MNALQRLASGLPFGRLALKIVFAISFSVLVIQLALLGYVENRIYESELDKIVYQQQRFTEANAMYMAELIDDNQEDNIYLVLSTIIANPLIMGARLDFFDGREFLNVGPNQTPLVYSIEITDLDEDDNFKKVGTLSTYATTEFIDESRSERTKTIITSMLILFLVVLLISFLAVHLMVGIPLKRIMNAISDRNETPDINWNSRDEMGAVVKRLNYLHSTLRNQLSGLKQELSDNEEREIARMHSLVNASLEGLLLYRENMVVDLNEPMAKLLGKPNEILIDQPVSKTLNIDEELINKQSVLRSVVEQQESLSACMKSPVVTDLKQENGKTLPVEVYFKPLESHPNADSVAIVRDLTERRIAEKEMWKLAHLDSLTNLPNRRYFSELLNAAISRAEQQNCGLTVAYIDLDNFKFINDSRGHASGDQLLCAVSDSISECLGAGEKCARLGGDEFAILIEERQNYNATDLLDRVVSSIIGGPHCSQWKGLFSVSVGAANLNGVALDKNELLMRADLALYKAKEMGRGRISWYSEKLDGQLKRSRKIVEKLLVAIEQDELELYYQPQILCNSNVIVGFEALLRWNDPVLGFVSPVEIVEVAEREGIATTLSRWVISHAIKEALTWPEHIRLAINISPMELADENLVPYIENTLDETGFTSNRLEIEITETALIEEMSRAKEIIIELKRMGLMIALDDFGTGYSSLSMLQNFPFDRIKIDRSFVSNLCEEPAKASIVASIIDLGKRLDLDVIAEGVETESDRAKLLEFDCNECQGYLISCPMPAHELDDFMSAYSISKVQPAEHGRWKNAV